MSDIETPVLIAGGSLAGGSLVGMSTALLLAHYGVPAPMLEQHRGTALNEGVRDVSPTLRVFITQSLLEPLLKSRTEELGARWRFGTEMLSFEQYADGVTALIRDRDRGETSKVRARYWWARTDPAAKSARAWESGCKAAVCFRTAPAFISGRISRRCCAAC